MCRYSAEFKAMVALEANRDELTTAELAKKYGIHLTIVSGWKKRETENVAFRRPRFDGPDRSFPSEQCAPFPFPKGLGWVRPQQGLE